MLPPLAAEKLQNFFGVFLQFQIGVDTIDGVCGNDDEDDDSPLGR